MENPAPFKTRTLRPTNEVAVRFKKLTEVRVTICADHHEAELTAIGLSASGKDDMSALRALGDAVQAEILRLTLLSKHQLTPDESRRRLWLMSEVDLFTSCLLIPDTLN
jgi:hypothetical protein